MAADAPRTDADRPAKDPTGLGEDTHRRLGIDLYNHVWTLIPKADRTPAETDEMIHAAHASRYHWSFAGTEANLARGDWQVARVYAELGRGEEALYHARRCLEHAQAATDAGVAEDWDLPGAYEGMARALLVAGDVAGAREWHAKGMASLDGIKDPDDCDHIREDLESLGL